MAGPSEEREDPPASPSPTVVRFDRPREGSRPVLRRRPSGEAPPLPRHVSRSTRTFLGAGVVVALLWTALSTTTGVRVVTAGDLVVLRGIARVRSDPLVDVVQGLNTLGSPWAFRVVGWTTLIVLAAVRRFQHLLAVLTVVLVASVLDGVVAIALGRMRPAGVDIVGPWDGYAHPSLPVANLGLALTAVLFTLVPGGLWRTRAAWAAVAVVALLGAARLVLAVDHPTDVAAALVTGMALPAAAFRLLTPEEAFPVAYRRGVRAHLDVGGRRGEAIRYAVARQMGENVTAIEPFGLGSSAGSMPLRLVTDAPGAERQLFGKLYASTHLWSDRWYKLARTVRYGRLEDERPFNTVRRLVEYEDHMLRVMRDAGLPTAEPYGIVEITPDREYLIVTELLTGAAHPTDADVTDDVIDDALRVVRRMWDAGLAHRDIKPANVLVRDGRVLLIDVAFAEVRPTPWRQAVDLANMMLTLALCTSPERVYERARLVFSPDEISEALAASQGVTIPSQLRTLLREQDEDLLGSFRALAPPRPPVAIQHWSVRRLGLTMGVLGGALVALALVAANLRLTGLL
ncbi:MAG TPA: RIO1 family regulatory kinase/ATPase [Acidimicrobiales bacterium]|nr:RIO1 family regulatory kinase/ATPase [Acidimicrobiales bacterium]